MVSMPARRGGVLLWMTLCGASCKQAPLASRAQCELLRDRYVDLELSSAPEARAMTPEGRAALRFSLDLPGATLLGAAAVLWICAGLYAARSVRESSDPDSFVVSWLMTLTGCVGVFLAADLIGFYFLLAVLSVGASGLVLQGKGPQAVRASAIYLGLALFAEAILLVGLILLARAVPNGSLLIRDAAAALPNSPWRGTTLLLLLAGLGIKAGLLPLHFWLSFRA